MSPDRPPTKPPSRTGDPYGAPNADHPHYREGIVNWPNSFPLPELKITRDPLTHETLPLEVPEGWALVYFDGYDRLMHTADMADMLGAMTNAERAQFVKDSLGR